MPIVADRAEEIIAAWRAGIELDGFESPAGPLFASGRYAEADIVTMCTGSGRCGTECSGSRPYQCC